MADFKIRSLGRASSSKSMGDRPNGSQYRPTSPGVKRVIVEKVETPSTGIDRFALHTRGNTKISLNGQDISALTEYDPEYNLSAYSGYEMAQLGVFVNLPSVDNIEENLGYNGSTVIITDRYANPEERGNNEEYQIRGIPLELYTILTTGNPINLAVTALTTQPILTNQPIEEPSFAPMALVVGDSPLGVSPRRKHYDLSNIMSDSDALLSVQTPTKGSCVLTPSTAQKMSWLRYCPKILRPPVYNSQTENMEHTFGIVVSMNGGTPRFVKYTSRLNLASQGAENVDTYGWRDAIKEIGFMLNDEFRDDFFEYLKRDARLNQKYSLSGDPNYFNGFSNDLFKVSNSPGAVSFVGTQSMFGSMSYIQLGIGGFERYPMYGDNELDSTIEVFANPLYVTIHPNHALLKADPTVSIDLGVESMYNQNSTLKPFNVHTSSFARYEYANT